MKALIYSLMPDCIIRAIRRRRDAKRRYKLACREFKFHDSLSVGD